MRTEDALRLHVGGEGGHHGHGSAGSDGNAGRANGPAPLAPGAEFDLPASAASHVKVRRLQPAAALRLFDGRSGKEWPAEVLAISRGAVRVRVGMAPMPAAAAELPVHVSLAFGMPANERVDALVEKATELGVAALWPLMSERSVLLLDGERAKRRRAHWQAVAAAACEQCGRARVPTVHAVQPLQAWLQARRGESANANANADAGANARSTARWLLSTRADAPPLAGPGVAGAWAAWGARDTNAATATVPAPAAPKPAGVLVLSGPEGGLTPQEAQAALGAGFTAVSLGPRILRADTAPLAVLAWIGIALAQRPEAKAGA